MLSILISLSLLFCPYVTGDKWAVLVAGSNNYYNYRHQADICHAYQIFHENGFPDSNIIVMMYDDIAHNGFNPFPGVILNKVGGNNLYTGVLKDYTGEAVTPENFLAVLRGDNSTGSKVLNTGPDDDIFIYFADHGATGLIAFPNGELYAHDLISTLEYMYNNKKYNSIVFYLEACESGSMFNNLLSSNMSILAITAANPYESSWGCCYDNTVEAYVGDVFSVNWLNNADNFESIMTETIENQYSIVQQETNTSHVCMYGDLSLANIKLSLYLVYGNEKPNPSPSYTNTNRNRIFSGVRSRDIKRNFLTTELFKNRLDKSLAMELEREIFHDQLLRKMFGNRPLNDPNPSCYSRERIDTHCIQRMINNFKKNFGPLTDIAMDYIRLIAAPCFT